MPEVMSAVEVQCWMAHEVLSKAPRPASAIHTEDWDSNQNWKGWPVKLPKPASCWKVTPPGGRMGTPPTVPTEIPLRNWCCEFTAPWLSCDGLETKSSGGAAVVVDVGAGPEEANMPSMP